MRMTVRERWEAPNRGREDRELRVRVRGRKELACFVALIPGNFSSAFAPELVHDTLAAVEEGAVIGRYDRGVSGGGYR